MSSRIYLQLDSYIKDTNHFLEKIKSLNLSPDKTYILATADITSLYTNIPHEDGIQSVLSYYSKYDRKLVSMSTLDGLLRLVLNNNILSFDGIKYLQMGGTAMGTKMSSSYANLFMGTLETKQSERANIISIYNGRFLDDLIYIFENTSMNDIKNFFEDFNSIHPNIKLTWNISTKSIDFLDVHLSLTKNNHLETNLHRSSTNRQKYLNFFSEHPHHMKKSIPYGLSTRLRRICSNDNDLQENLSELRNTLYSNGYPVELVNNAISKALQPRNMVGTTSNNTNSNENVNNKKTDWNKTTKFITPYNSKNPNLSRILENHIGVLTNHLSGAFNDLKIKVVNRRPKNLSDDLVHSTLMPSNKNQNTGIPCKDKRCLACPSMILSTKISNYKNDFVFDIVGSFSCHTKDCVYLLQCSICKIQYVGQTETTFNLRLNNHRRDSLIEGPIYNHVVETNYVHNFDHFKWTILKSNFGGSTKDRENFESWSIHKFDLFNGYGLNKTPGVFPGIF
jgi:hypothetical protein